MNGAVSYSMGPTLPGSLTAGREFYEIGLCPSGVGYCQRINGGPWTPYKPEDADLIEFDIVPELEPWDFNF